MTMGTLFVWMLILFHKKSWVNPFKGPWIKLGLIGIFGLALTTVFLQYCFKRVECFFIDYSSVSVHMDDNCNGLYRETKASKKGRKHSDCLNIGGYITCRKCVRDELGTI